MIIYIILGVIVLCLLVLKVISIFTIGHRDARLDILEKNSLASSLNFDKHKEDNQGAIDALRNACTARLAEIQSSVDKTNAEILSIAESAIEGRQDQVIPVIKKSGLYSCDEGPQVIPYDSIGFVRFHRDYTSGMYGNQYHIDLYYKNAAAGKCIGGYCFATIRKDEAFRFLADLKTHYPDLYPIEVDKFLEDHPNLIVEPE